MKRIAGLRPPTITLLKGRRVAVPPQTAMSNGIIDLTQLIAVSDNLDASCSYCTLEVNGQGGMLRLGSWMMLPPPPGQPWPETQLNSELKDQQRNMATATVNVTFVDDTPPTLAVVACTTHDVRGCLRQ